MSKLTEALEAGKPIEGLKGYIRIQPDRYNHSQEPIYIKVQCQALKIKDCNITIIADVISGAGQIQVCPENWLDDPNGIKKDRDRIQRDRAMRIDRQTILGPHYQHHKIAALQKYLDTRMDQNERQDFYRGIQDELNLTETPSSIPKLNASILTKFATKAIAVVNHAPPDDED